MRQSEFFNDILSQISQKLSEGVLPWRRTWRVGLPSNFISKKAYSGVNFLSLSNQSFPSQYFATFLQIKELGGSVNKGAQGLPIVFWNLIEKDDDENKKHVPVFRISYVFNLFETTLFNPEVQPQIQSCESVISSMPTRPKIKHNFSRCYYNPLQDYISLPFQSDFESTEEYYSSLFHELVHATGHPSRLNRKLLNLSDEERIVEELIAELGATFLAAKCGIELTTFDNSASYIAGWLRLSQDSKNVFLRAVQQSRLASEYVVGGLNKDAV